MKHRMVFAAMAASVIIAGACADRDGGERLATEPSGGKPMVSYVTSGAVAVVDRRTHRLTPVTADASRSGVSASIAAGSGDAPPLQLTNGEPGIARTGGKAVFTFTDDAHHRHQIVLLYRSPGGPPAAMQHYTDGVLVNTTAYVWGKTSTGWVRTRSVMQSLRNGALVGTYSITSTAVPTKPGNGGPNEMVMLDRAPVVSPMQKAVGAFAYGLAYALGPEDAKAQTFSFYDCRIEWLHYVGSAVILAAAGSALGAAPALTPLLISAFVAALTSTAIYEDELLDCILSHQSLASGSFGGGDAMWPDGKWDCFDGSYSAHCTTAFTL